MTVEPPFYEWLRTAGSLDNVHPHYTCSQVLKVIDLYLQHSPQMTIRYRHNDLCIPTLLFAYCEIPYASTYMITTLHKFKAAGMMFHDKYYMMWDTVQENADVVEFLLSNGMTIENLLCHDMNGDACSLNKSVLYESVNKACRYYLTADNISATNYHNINASITVMIDHGLENEEVINIIKNTKNPHWDWGSEIDKLVQFKRQKKFDNYNVINEKCVELTKKNSMLEQKVAKMEKQLQHYETMYHDDGSK